MTCAILHKNVGHAFDIFFVFLNQRPLKKWDAKMTAPFIGVMILMQVYLCVVTSYLTKPLSFEQFTSLEEIKNEKGIKYLLDSEDVVQIAEQFLKVSKKIKFYFLFCLNIEGFNFDLLGKYSKLQEQG